MVNRSSESESGGNRKIGSRRNDSQFADETLHDKDWGKGPQK